MPRIRTIKPEIWSDEKLAPCDPLTRLVFIALFSLADDAGRLIDNVKQIDGALFPETDDSCGEALETLARLSRIVRYTSNSGQRLIQILNWKKHQKVSHPSAHVLPAPTAEDLSQAEKQQRVTKPLRKPSGEPPEVRPRVARETPASTLDHGPRTITETDAKASEAGASRNEELPFVDVPPPPPPPPDTGAVPEPDLGAVIAPLIREHLWLATSSAIPQELTRQDPKWSMARELSIARGFVQRGECKLEELAGAITVARSTLALPPGRPLWMKIFNVRDRHDRLQVCISEWRRLEAEKQRKSGGRHISSVRLHGQA